MRSPPHTPSSGSPKEGPYPFHLLKDFWRRGPDGLAAALTASLVLSAATPSSLLGQSQSPDRELQAGLGRREPAESAASESPVARRWAASVAGLELGRNILLMATGMQSPDRSSDVWADRRALEVSEARLWVFESPISWRLRMAPLSRQILPKVRPKHR